MKIRQESYDRLVRAARQEWNKTPPGPAKLEQAKAAIGKLLDGMDLPKSERDDFIASMVEQLVGNPSVDAAYFGQRSSEFTLGDREVYSADRSLWPGWGGGRLSNEVQVLKRILEGVNTGLDHEGKIRGFERIELRQPEPPKPGQIFSRDTPDSPVFDGSKKFEVVAVSKSYQASVLGHVNLQPLLLKMGNPTKWSQAESDAFRQQSREEIMKLVSKVPPDPSYRRPPVDFD